MRAKCDQKALKQIIKKTEKSRSTWGFPRKPLFAIRLSYTTLHVFQFRRFLFFTFGLNPRPLAKS